MHSEQYDGLGDLLNRNARAGEYFGSLPGYVQETIRQRGDSIRSEDILRRYAENFMQGDK